MGTVNIAFQKTMDGIAPVYYPARASENVTSSGTAASATNSPRYGEVARIAPKDVDIAVKINGTATAADVLVKSGATYDLGGFSGGETISVIEV